jgi:hypothetical protein
MQPHCHTRVRRPQINPYRWPLIISFASHSRRLENNQIEVDEEDYERKALNGF